MENKRVLFLVPYPHGVSPSQRFRLELYEATMQEEGVEYVYAPFLSESVYPIFFEPGNTFKKALGIISGYFRRYGQLFRMRRCNVVWVHRETAPMALFPFYNFLLTKCFGKNVVFEMDDAVWMPNVSSANAKFQWLKPFKNSLRMMKWAKTVVCGNEFLRQKALEYNENATLLPTGVDTALVHNQEQNQQSEHVRVGWTGSHSTLPYLEKIVPILKELYPTRPFQLVVISDVEPQLDFPDVNYIPWNKITEIADLLRFHIGLMPIPNKEWTEGKCGLKIIQYQSLGIVPIASPFGVNKELIGNNERGLLVNDLNDWKNKLDFLLRNEGIRTSYAAKCRPFILEHYSIQSQRDKFLHLLEED